MLLLLYISRITLEEMRQRQYCEFTYWINTTQDDLCTHCIRILSMRLCIDDMSDRNYWKYMKATPLERIRLREKCVELYFVLFQEYTAMGGPQ